MLLVGGGAQSLDTMPRQPAPVGVHAQDHAIDRCGDVEQRGARIDCYEQAFAVLVDDAGAAPAIAHFSDLGSQDAVLAADCHLALHAIGDGAGRRIAAEGRPLPMLDPGDFCHQGYVHGLMIAYFDSVDLQHEAPASPSSCGGSNLLRAWSCAHVLGHVYARRASFAMAGTSHGCLAGARSVVPWTMPFDRNSWLSSCMKGAVMEFALHDMDQGRDEPRPGTCIGVVRELERHCYSFVSLMSAVGGESTLATQREACVALAPVGVPRDACLKVWRRTARLSQLPPDLACETRSTAREERAYSRC